MPDAAMNAVVLPDPADRETALPFVRETPFVYGIWNRFKRFYKAVESDPNADVAIQGALLARVDSESVSLDGKDPLVAFATMRTVSKALARGDDIFAFRANGHINSAILVSFSRNPNDPMKPTRRGSLNLEVPSNEVGGSTLCGSLLCVTVRGNRGVSELRVIDISDSARMQSRGSYSFGASVVLADSEREYPYLYVAVSPYAGAKFQGLRVLDMTTSDAVQVAGEVALNGLSGEAGTIAVRHGLAALVTKPVGFTWRSLPRDGGVYLIDVSAPRQPRLLGNLDLQTPICVALQGRSVYVAISSSVADQSGLQIVDATDPRRPRKAGFLPLPPYLTSLAVSPDGNYVYAHTSGGTLFTIDVRDNAAPRLVDTTDGLYGTTNFAFAGNQAYLSGSWRGIALFDFSRPEKPYRIGGPPSPETMGYLKRRGRRTLRHLAKTDASRYVELATEFLQALTGEKDKPVMLDPTRHWAALDVLFGGGPRFRQTKHGRGRYVPTAQAARRLTLRTREERSPAAWDGRPDLLARLVAAPNRMPAVYAFAARALRANRVPLPRIEDDVLEAWLAGDEPLLIALGVRSVTGRLLAGETVSPTLAADSFFSAGATTRRKLAEEQSGNWAGKRTWAETFALRLAARVTPVASPETSEPSRFSRRQLDGAVVLARRFSWALAARSEALLPLLAALLVADRDDLRSLAAAGAANVAPANLLTWLTQLGRVPDAALREPVLIALSASLAGVTLTVPILRSFIFNLFSSNREAGWRLIAASATGGDLLRPLWAELLESRETTPALATAMASPYALGLLERAGIGSAEIVGFVSARPALVGLLSPQAFASVAATAPASVVLSLIAASPDENWALFRPVLLRQLHEGVGLMAFWLAAESAVMADGTGRMETRLLGDADIAETLLGVEEEGILAIREPAFGAILGAWAARHAARFVRNSSLLYDAATHPLPEVRTPALARVGEVGMDMPFALRLVESALPPSVVVGRGFFDAEPSGGSREPDYALALCDSPDADVRTLGREYVTARWATLPHERILLALFENPDPAMQAFVASLLDTGADTARSAVPQFDAEVLRTTNRARAAKEKIKARQTAESSVDVATLLTVARARRTPRDADWALGELARRVARGETVEGITVEGVVGI